MIVEERIEHSLKKNELIISVDEYDVNAGYQERMLLENKIEGLCPLRIIYSNEVKQYCYEISNHETLKEIGERKKLSYKFLKRLLIQLEHCLEMLDRYMIDENKILFEAEYIFVDIYSETVSMIFFPYKKEEIMDFVSLSEYLIRVVNQEDELATWTAYTLERDAKRVNFSFVSFLDAMRNYEMEKEKNANNDLIKDSFKVASKEASSTDKEKKEDKSRRLMEVREPIRHLLRMVIGVSLGIMYFIGAYMISKVYTYSYESSMVIIVVLGIVTFVVFLWNVIGVIREKPATR